MPLSVEEITAPRADTRRLPEALAAGGLLLADLQRTGQLGQLAGALPVSRHGGHTAPNLLAWALVFLLAGPAWGIKPFWTQFKRSLARVAAVVGLSALPSASSVSRALRKLDTDTVEAFTDAVLTALPGADDLLAHPSVQYRDRTGRLHHFVDLDPTPQAFRQRDLVDDDQRPAPQRRAPGVPGYCAHHRGERRIQHVPCQHAGSGLWMAYRLRTGHGGTSALAVALTRQVRARLSQLPGPLSLVMRADQEFGAAGIASAIVAEDVHLLVRLARYALLDQEEVVARMASGPWLPVPSTGSRHKEALDLGQFLLHPDEDAEDAARPPVQLRVVVSRHVCEDKPDKGVLRGGYQLELFATTLPFEGFDAADVVSAYADRSSIENGFASEDRELSLGRTFSYHAAGQQWMVAVGLWLWNWLLLEGVARKPLPAVPAPPPAQAQTATQQAVHGWVCATAVPATLEPAAISQLTGACDAPVAESCAVGGSCAPVDEHPAVPCDPATQQVSMGLLLSEVFADVLEQRGWTLEPQAEQLRCPQGQALRPSTVTSARLLNNAARLVVRSELGACVGCPVRSGCFRSERAHVYKELSRRINDEQQTASRLWLAEQRRKKQAGRRSASKRPTEAVPTCAAFTPQAPPPSWLAPPQRRLAAAQPLQSPLFRPAQARHLGRASLRAAWVEITLGRPRARAKPHPLLAESRAEKSRLRRTWTQRNDRWRTERSVHLRVQRLPT